MDLPNTVPTVSSGEREGLIHLDVTVSDSKGNLVGGLRAEDFKLHDNNTETKIISLMSSDQARGNSERLTEVIFVLDEVNLTAEELIPAKNAVVSFLRRNGGILTTNVSVYWLSMNGFYATAGPRKDGNAIADDIANERFPRVIPSNLGRPVSLPGMLRGPMAAPTQIVPRSRAVFADAVTQTLYGIALDRRDSPGRKLVVWFGPGWPVNFSQRSGTAQSIFEMAVELSTRLRESRIVLNELNQWPDAASLQGDYRDYLTGIRSTADLNGGKFAKFPFAPVALPVLAIQSGGMVREKVSDAEIAQCIEHATSFYTVSFDPPPASQPDEYHSLRVEVRGSNLTAYTDSGYYDEPVFYDQPSVPETLVSVHELAQMLKALHGERGKQVVAKLNSLELTERMSSSLLKSWKNQMRGDEEKEALAALADQSAFLPPPADTVPSVPAPNGEEQDAILARAEVYANDILRELPDFVATRTVKKFEQGTPNEMKNWKTAIANQSMQKTGNETATLSYRKGGEVQADKKETGDRNAKLVHLDFTGIFGPLLHSVLTDATLTRSTLRWRRWEQDGVVRTAVFSYAVTGPSQSYSVNQCCLRNGIRFVVQPDFHGELVIVPETGAILRLTMESEPGWVVEPDLNPVQPMIAAKMMVEYAPVDIGGRKFVCPTRSVVMTRARQVISLVFWNQIFEVYGAYLTLLNDVAYSDYHKFGSESRILPGYEPVPNANGDARKH